MKFIEALKLRSKLLFLLVLITFGLIAISVIGTANVNAMKKNTDSLYFGSLVPIYELNEIVQIYNGELSATVFKAKASEINSDEFYSDITSSLEKIQKIWKSYESHFKRDEEIQYVEYVSMEIKNTNIYFEKLLKYAKDGHGFENVSIQLLEEKIQHIYKSIKKLINYEVDVAKYERKNFLENYDATLKQLGIVLLMVIFGLLVISYQVFKSIQDDQTELEVAHKKLKKANKKLEDASYTDSLTKLHNRRYFNMVYEREFKRAKRSKKHFTFMMLDIDYFKQYNDTYGHVGGDNALKKVASALNSIFKRPSDYVFRLGGEEFGVLMSETDPHNSSKMAQKICDTVLGLKVEHKASQVNDYVTISVGVVSCIVHPSINEEYIITKADKMLYKAKENGRNRYILSANECS
ncbi:diguanylate cyclase [Sulfurimonas sp.]|uniref:diguanylate cyclase n=1 Tax=Sulfurimonas sp. TaxID=2022749 RepID=UPI003567323A